MPQFAHFVVCSILLAPAVLAETVVVLPFFNLTKARNLDWIGEGVAGDISESLAGRGWLVVDRETRDEGMRRLAVRRYAKLARGSVMEISLNLDADMVVWGEFDQPAPGQVRLRAMAASVRQVRKYPAIEETGPMERLSALQNSISRCMVNALSPGRPLTEAEFQASHPAVRVDALESYVRGLLATGYDEKHRLFARAAHLEPTYAEPVYQLGKIQYARNNYRTAADWFLRVPPTNSHYRESQFFLGLCRYETGDFAAARDAFQTVAAQVPLAEVFNNLGAAQLRLSLPEAAESFAKALESDRTDPDYHFNLGYASWKQGDFERATTLFRAALERTPDDQTATLLLGRCLKKSGPRPGELRTEGQERLKTNYDETAWRHLTAVLETRKPE